MIWQDMMILIEIIIAIIAMLIASFPILGVGILGLIMVIGLPTGFIALIVLIIQGIRNTKASKINYHAMVDATQRLLQKIHNEWDALQTQYPPLDGTSVHEIPTLWNRPKNRTRIWKTQSDLMISTMCTANINHINEQYNEQSNHERLESMANQMNAANPASFIYTQIIPLERIVGIYVMLDGGFVYEFKERWSDSPDPPDRKIAEHRFNIDKPCINLQHCTVPPLKETVMAKLGSYKNIPHHDNVYLNKQAYPVLLELIPDIIGHSQETRAQYLLALDLISEQEYQDRIKQDQPVKESQ